MRGYPILITKKNDWTLTFSHSKLKITYRRLQIAVNCFQITDCSLHIADYRLYVAHCSLHMHLDLDLNVKPNLELNLKLNLELNVKLCKQCRGGQGFQFTFQRGGGWSRGGMPRETSRQLD